MRTDAPCWVIGLQTSAELMRDRRTQLLQGLHAFQHADSGYSRILSPVRRRRELCAPEEPYESSRDSAEEIIPVFDGDIPAKRSAGDAGVCELSHVFTFPFSRRDRYSFVARASPFVRTPAHRRQRRRHHAAISSASSWSYAFLTTA